MLNSLIVLIASGGKVKAMGEKQLIRKDIFLTASLYLAGAFLLTCYGINTCRVLESLGPIRLGIIILSAFIIALGLRTAFVQWLKRREEKLGKFSDQIAKDPWHYLLVDLCSWLFVGVLVMVWNSNMYDFSLKSGAKVILGCFTLGVFSSLHNSLIVERELLLELAESVDVKTYSKQRFLSLSTKFIIFVTTSLILIATIILLVMFKNLDSLLTESSAISSQLIYGSIAGKVALILTVLCFGTVAVAFQYSKNLKMVLALQLRAFKSVENGLYNSYIPAISRDEFSHIADGTNNMIKELKDKRCPVANR